MSYDLLHGDDSVYLAHYGVKGMRWGIQKAIRSKIEGRRQKIANRLRKEAANYSKVANRIEGQIRSKPEIELADTINAEKKVFRKASAILHEVSDTYEVDNERTGKPIPGAMAKAKQIHKMAYEAEDLSRGNFESDLDYTVSGSARKKAVRASNILREVANIKKVEAKEWDDYKKVSHEKKEWQMAYDLLHGDDSKYLVHYGAKGMQWGVRKDEESGGSVRRDATASKAAAAKKAGGSAGVGPKLAKKGSAEEVYSSAFAKALGEPPITAKKIAAATKAAEKAVEDAGLEEDGEGKGKGEEEKKKGGAGPKDLDAEKKKKEEKKRAKIAKDRAANAELAKEMLTGMDAELAGETKRTSETLKREALIVVSMLKMVAHDKKTFEILQSIGSRSNAESKGGERRSAEQLKTDAAFVKKLAERFTKEADFIGNFGKKDQVKHEKQEWQMAYDLLHGDDSEHLAHYGTKGMRWGVRKKVGNLGRAIKEQHAKDVAHARDRDVKMLRGLGMHKSADAVAANKSAGHALGKNLKAAITLPRGKKMITIGAVVVAGTALGIAGWDWQADSTVKLRY